MNEKWRTEKEEGMIGNGLRIRIELFDTIGDTFNPKKMGNKFKKQNLNFHTKNREITHNFVILTNLLWTFAFVNHHHSYQRDVHSTCGQGQQSKDREWFEWRGGCHRAKYLRMYFTCGESSLSFSLQLRFCLLLGSCFRRLVAWG